MRSRRGRPGGRAGLAAAGVVTASLALAVGATAAPSSEHENSGAAQGSAMQQSHANSAARSNAVVHTRAHARGAASVNGHAVVHSRASAGAANASATALARANTRAALQTQGSFSAHARSQANAHRSARGSVRSGTRGPAQKATICHATDSHTNPFVAITVSGNAVPAHMSNHVRAAGWQDFLFTGGACAASVSGKSHPAGNGPNGGAGKVTICHATDSLTNPFVIITISMNALPAHMTNHVRAVGWQDVLFTGSACPANVSAPTHPGASPNVTPGAPGQGPSVGVAPAERAPAPSASAPAARTENAVLHPASAPASAVAGQAVAATSTQSSGSLPFTGFQALTALLVAAALLGTGVLVRRLSASKQ